MPPSDLFRKELLFKFKIVVGSAVTYVSAACIVSIPWFFAYVMGVQLRPEMNECCIIFAEHDSSAPVQTIWPSSSQRTLHGITYGRTWLLFMISSSRVPALQWLPLLSLKHRDTRQTLHIKYPPRPKPYLLRFVRCAILLPGCGCGCPRVIDAPASTATPPGLVTPCSS